MAWLYIQNVKFKQTFQNFWVNTESNCYVFMILSGGLFPFQTTFNNRGTEVNILVKYYLRSQGQGLEGQHRIRLSWQIVNGLYFIYTRESWNHMKGQAHWRNCILHIDITSGRKTPTLGTRVFWKAHFSVHLWLGCLDNLGFMEWEDPRYLTEGMSVCLSDKIQNNLMADIFYLLKILLYPQS